MRNADADDASAASAGRDWLAELQELLLTGGYFRARIATLTPFDKARSRSGARHHAKPRRERRCASPPRRVACRAARL